ncbi:response regulator [Fictibacillus phosphorivorans]|uniref:response regulator n=1 Tax=Fictibacillus phosphorivorans TaxID=1221500 RepID=UPI00203E1057|nr:response regulator [Fictibacillus phosphorivorans]MCM3718987.1 response regulator [Fictibacillus phosphorivorans]MCM3776609.1 response regulator [Fictibacillus phosphorivorans]
MSKLKVLLIEDDPMVQEINKAFIEKVKGFKVIACASDGNEGISLVRKLKPDLVVLDIYMPGQDGMKTLRQIRNEKIPVDVIIITAANDQESIRAMLQNGAFDYIIKPFNFDRIKKALEKYKDFHTTLSPSRSVTQKELDTLFFAETSRTVADSTELPKGLNEITLRQIEGFLKTQTVAKSAEEVAEGVGIARVTARRYLDYLVKNGSIELDIQYGTIGRPVNRYLLKK